MWRRIDAGLDDFSTKGIGLGFVHCVDSEQFVIAVIPDRPTAIAGPGPDYAVVMSLIEPDDL